MSGRDLRMIEGGRRPAPAGIPELAGDYLNARRFLDTYGHDVRHAPELGRDYIWSGAWWREDRLGRVLDLAATIIDELRLWVADAPNPDDFKRRSAHYQASAKAGRREALLSIVRTDPDVVVGVEQLDTHDHLLACSNGTIDLTTGELQPANRDHLISHGVSIEYDPEARSELWEKKFISRIFNEDDELIAYVQRLLGYCLTGAVHEHVLASLFGSGANGKSVLVGVVQDTLGEHATTAPEGLIIAHGHEPPHPERLAVLRGRRLVASFELEQKAVLAEQMVKMLTGGDTITARELYGRRFNFRPTHKILLVTNHRPQVRGTDHAIWRRLRVVPFEQVIPADEQDPTLRRRLVEEHGPAVLAWLVRGAVEWYRCGLGDAGAVNAATEQYRAAQDTMAAFLAEETVEIPNIETKVGVLFRAWREWCDHNGERPGRAQDFTAALTDHGIEVRSYKHNRLARGIGLLVSTGEGSPRNLPIETSTRTFRGSAHQHSPEGTEQGESGKA